MISVFVQPTHAAGKIEHGTSQFAQDVRNLYAVLRACVRIPPCVNGVQDDGEQYRQVLHVKTVEGHSVQKNVYHDVHLVGGVFVLIHYMVVSSGEGDYLPDQ